MLNLKIQLAWYNCIPFMSRYFQQCALLHFPPLSMNTTVHVHVYIVPTMLTELLYPLQREYTPLHLAAWGGHTTCVEHLLSTPGIDVNIKNWVSCSMEPPLPPPLTISTVSWFTIDIPCCVNAGVPQSQHLSVCT